MTTPSESTDAPAGPLEARRGRRSEFWRRLAKVVGITLAASFAIVLVRRQFNVAGLSNHFFWAAFVLLAIAALPIVSEMGSSVSLVGRAAIERKSLRSLFAGEQEKRERGADQTILYGLAGVLFFILSLLVLAF